MTLPTSGPISTADILAECGLPNGPASTLSTQSLQMRLLSGGKSTTDAIKIPNDFWGKRGRLIASAVGRDLGGGQSDLPQIGGWSFLNGSVYQVINRTTGANSWYLTIYLSVAGSLFTNPMLFQKGGYALQCRYTGFKGGLQSWDYGPNTTPFTDIITPNVANDVIITPVW
ncbi:hypothetical protein KMB83_gp18 [Ralstonia phage Anchaing]|uniref:Uncharacterized protein n=1 Tax=Ralstonia phage Anchaing TaxID=2759719 RepID=A0A7G5B8B5_9CAUD|nr:hypothetical protein KMB83_gp18 [Ralstonia phage Anchaing]QMV32538.1 hypothetical protein A1_00018 [Ralstonia phage Anchaing]